MKKIRYSPDVDAMLIEICDPLQGLRQRPIAYAEDEGQMILHYSSSGELVLIEILDVKQFISSDYVTQNH
jgi:uncharacterized protein YuzE